MNPQIHCNEDVYMDFEALYHFLFESFSRQRVRIGARQVINGIYIVKNDPRTPKM